MIFWPFCRRALPVFVVLSALSWGGAGAATTQSVSAAEPQAPHSATEAAELQNAPSSPAFDPDPASARPATEPASAPLAILEGHASFYGARFHGRRTASGERYNSAALTAAHRSLPFGTRVRVFSLQSGQAVTVRINDRGPIIRARVIDLSRAAAEALGMVRAGSHQVRLEVLHPLPTLAP